MMFNYDKYLNNNNPSYNSGYEDGFNDAKDEMVRELEKMIKYFKNLKSYREFSGTTTVHYYIFKK